VNQAYGRYGQNYTLVKQSEARKLEAAYWRQFKETAPVNLEKFKQQRDDAFAVCNAQYPGPSNVSHPNYSRRHKCQQQAQALYKKQLADAQARVHGAPRARIEKRQAAREAAAAAAAARAAEAEAGAPMTPFILGGAGILAIAGLGYWLYQRNR